MNRLEIVSHKRRRSVTDEDDEMDIMMLKLCLVFIWIFRLSNDFIPKKPTRDYDHERSSFLNRIYHDDEIECVEQLRVSRRCFANLCHVLEEKGHLTRTKFVPIEEAVAMFLHIIGHNLKYRVIHNMYFRSKETISRQFNSVLRAVMNVSKDYIKSTEFVLNDSDTRKWQWFQNCIGALDGTHVHVTVPQEDRPRYRNRKGDISTNVLGVCNPDLKFTYVLPGWEGSASDSRVLHDAICRRHRLHIPKDKYYLVDAGYTNGPGFLAPYRGTRYHLNEWKGNRPQNYKELFNLRHSSARNTIERCFGVLKKRWSILRTPSFFDIRTQIRIISACCVLHNFIRLEQSSDPILEVQHRQFLRSVDNDLRRQVVDDGHNNEEEITTIRVTAQWTEFCEALAKNMFENYVAQRA